jgi:hypothetical protein
MTGLVDWLLEPDFGPVLEDGDHDHSQDPERRPSVPLDNPEFGRHKITAQQLDLLRIDVDGRGHTLGFDGAEWQLGRKGEAEFRRIWDEHPEARQHFGVEPPESWREP